MNDNTATDFVAAFYSMRINAENLAKDYDTLRERLAQAEKALETIADLADLWEGEGTLSAGEEEFVKPARDYLADKKAHDGR